MIAFQAMRMGGSCSLVVPLAGVLVIPPLLVSCPSRSPAPPFSIVLAPVLFLCFASRATKRNKQTHALLSILKRLKSQNISTRQYMLFCVFHG